MVFILKLQRDDLNIPQNLRLLESQVGFRDSLWFLEGFFMGLFRHLGSSWCRVYRAYLWPNEPTFLRLLIKVSLHSSFKSLNPITLTLNPKPYVALNPKP